jgi:hypothetical protein
MLISATFASVSPARRLVALQNHTDRPRLGARANRSWPCFNVATTVLRDGVRSAPVRTDDDYLEEALVTPGEPADARKVATLFRRARRREGTPRRCCRVPVHLNAIIGGRRVPMPSRAPTVYPKAAGQVALTPRLVIGRTHYAKPISIAAACMMLPRAAALAMLHSMPRARASPAWTPRRCGGRGGDPCRGSGAHDAPLRDPLEWWHARLATALEEMPMQWADALLGPHRVEKVGDAA